MGNGNVPPVRPVRPFRRIAALLANGYTLLANGYTLLDAERETRRYADS
jgi:hypothetical protein